MIRMGFIHSWPRYWLMWPWWVGRMYRIMTRVTSDVGVPWSYLVYNFDDNITLNAPCLLLAVSQLHVPRNRICHMFPNPDILISIFYLYPLGNFTDIHVLIFPFGIRFIYTLLNWVLLFRCFRERTDLDQLFSEFVWLYQHVFGESQWK